MGSRISISLVDVVSHPKLSVLIEQTPITESDDRVDGEDVETTPTATVRVKSGTRWSDGYDFDLVVHEGKFTLERDFNFFRSAELHGNFMRFLFEYGICFRVIH